MSHDTWKGRSGDRAVCERANLSISYALHTTDTNAWRFGKGTACIIANRRGSGRPIIGSVATGWLFPFLRRLWSAEQPREPVKGGQDERDAFL